MMIDYDIVRVGRYWYAVKRMGDNIYYFSHRGYFTPALVYGTRYLSREEAWRQLPDECKVCHGERGGIRGNENLVDGVITCDYCYHLRASKGL
jgi:hypothetical protein